MVVSSGCDGVIKAGKKFEISQIFCAIAFVIRHRGYLGVSLFHGYGLVSKGSDLFFVPNLRIFLEFRRHDDRYNNEKVIEGFLFISVSVSYAPIIKSRNAVIGQNLTVSNNLKMKLLAVSFGIVF